MDLRGLVDITELDRDALVRAIYAASVPMGMGWLHATDGELDDTSLRLITDAADQYHEGGIDLDYVHGRQCKFRARKHEGKLYAKLDWYDHGIEAMKQLMRELKLPDVEARLAKAEAEGEERLKEDEEANQKYREVHP